MRSLLSILSTSLHPLIVPACPIGYKRLAAHGFKPPFGYKKPLQAWLGDGLDRRLPPAGRFDERDGRES